MTMQELLPMPENTTDQEIAKCNSWKDALRLSYQKSGKSLKVIAIELEELGYSIDAATLSLWLSENPAQKKNFDPDMVDDFIALTTEIPTRYLALKRGYGLVRLKSAVEMENERLKAELEKQKEEIVILTKYRKAGLI